MTTNLRLGCGGYRNGADRDILDVLFEIMHTWCGPRIESLGQVFFFPCSFPKRSGVGRVAEHEPTCPPIFKKEFDSMTSLYCHCTCLVPKFSCYRQTRGPLLQGK